MTGSSNTDVTVGADGFYTGSTIGCLNFKTKVVGGMLANSGSIGQTGSLSDSGMIYMAVSMDGTYWNYFYKSGSIISGSVPYIVTDEAQVSFIAPVLFNDSGSALSGSCWARAF